MMDRDNSKLMVAHNEFLPDYSFSVEPRGFGFVTYKSSESIDFVLATTEHYIDSKLVECKKAVPKEPIN